MATNPLAAVIQTQTNTAALVSSAQAATNTAALVSSAQAATNPQQLGQSKQIGIGITGPPTPDVTGHTYAILDTTVQGDSITILGSIDGGEPIAVIDSVSFLTSLADLPTLETYIATLLQIAAQTPPVNPANAAKQAVLGLGTFTQ